MFTMLVLVCSVSVSRGECSVKTADDVVLGSREGVSLQQCMFGGQARIAATKIAPEFSRQYEKVVCRARD